MSICCGDIVLPIIIIIPMMIFGINANLTFFIDNIVNAIKIDSRLIACKKNLGSPIGIPIIPVILIALSITMINFFKYN